MNYSGSNPLNPFAEFVDEHTVLFYPLDDGTIPYGSPTASMGFGGQPNSQTFESINNIEANMSLNSYYNKSINTPAPDTGKGCCFYSSVAGYGGIFSATGDSIPLTVVSAARDSWTWMGWFMPLSESSTTNRTSTIFCFTGNASGADESRNSLLHVGYYRNEESNANAGKILIGWHHGETVPQNIITTGKHLAPHTYGKWHHLAVTKEVSGSSSFVKVYVDGTAVPLGGTASTSSIITNATGGDNNNRQFGISQTVGSTPYTITGSSATSLGAVWRVQWDSVVHDDSFIYSASQDPYMSTTGSNTFVLWDLECYPDFRDYGPYGVHLHKGDTVNSSNPHKRTNASLYPMTYGLHAINNTSAISNVDLSNIKLTSGLDLAAVLTGSWTIETLCNMTDSTGVPLTAFSYCGKRDITATTGNEQDNITVCWFIDDASKSMKFVSNSGSMVRHDEFLWSESSERDWSGEVYWALTKEVTENGVSASYVLYKNGDPVYSFSAPNATVGTPSHDMRYQIFKIFNSSNTGGYLRVRLADHKLSNITRSAEYIRENFDRYYRNPKNLRLYQNSISSLVTYTTGSPDNAADFSTKMGEKYP